MIWLDSLFIYIYLSEMKMVYIKQRTLPKHSHKNTHAFKSLTAHLLRNEFRYALAYIFKIAVAVPYFFSSSSWSTDFVWLLIQSLTFIHIFFGVWLVQ